MKRAVIGLAAAALLLAGCGHDEPAAPAGQPVGAVTACGDFSKAYNDEMRIIDEKGPLTDYQIAGADMGRALIAGQAAATGALLAGFTAARGGWDAYQHVNGNLPVDEMTTMHQGYRDLLVLCGASGADVHLPD